jgi:hypothetical protein
MVKMTTGTVRFSYANVFQPKSNEEGREAKYSICLLIPKSDTATVEMVKAKISEAIEAGQSTLQGVKKGVKSPLRDGDEEKEAPEFAGHYFMNASSKRAPIVLDEGNQAILNRADFYSGCYGRASINFFAFAVSGNKGIGVGLLAVKKTRDGEALGGTYTEEDAAADFADDLL